MTELALHNDRGELPGKKHKETEELLHVDRLAGLRRKLAGSLGRSLGRDGQVETCGSRIPSVNQCGLDTVHESQIDASHW